MSSTWRHHGENNAACSDDYGSGVVLFLLKRLPVDYVKLALRYIQCGRARRRSPPWSRSSGKWPRTRRLVLRELVESGAALEVLGELGVDYAQGYVLLPLHVLCMGADYLESFNKARGRRRSSVKLRCSLVTVCGPASSSRLAGRRCVRRVQSDLLNLSPAARYRLSPRAAGRRPPRAYAASRRCVYSRRGRKQ